MLSGMFRFFLLLIEGRIRSYTVLLSNLSAVLLPILLLLSAVGVCAVAVLAREGVYLPYVAEDLRDVVRALGVVLAVRNVQVALADVVLHPVAVDAVLKRGIRIYKGNDNDFSS